MIQLFLTQISFTQSIYSCGANNTLCWYRVCADIVCGWCWGTQGLGEVLARKSSSFLMVSLLHSCCSLDRHVVFKPRDLNFQPNTICYFMAKKATPPQNTSRHHFPNSISRLIRDALLEGQSKSPSSWNTRKVHFANFIIVWHLN